MLKAAGFKACIFDKDNTLSEPFALQVPPKLLPSFQQCQQAFAGKITLFSNSAGLQQYDPQGKEAAALEAAFNVQVLRHQQKKPAGGCDELQQQFQ
jgi:phosphatidylglycerophosphatase GEP4